MLSKVFLDRTPEKFNKIKLTMEFWEENAEVTGGLNHLCNKRFLLAEIRL
jgi:hypothetical protein